MNSGLSRRTIVKGAAWSLPVIAASAASPAFAASPPPVCVDLGLPSKWSINIATTAPSSGVEPLTRHSPDDGFHIMANGSGLAYYVRSDGPAANALKTYYDLNSTFTATAGKTYTFTFTVLFNGGGNDNTSLAQQTDLEFRVNSTLLWSGNTYGTIPVVKDKKLAFQSSTSGMTIVRTFKATKSGTVPIQLRWVLRNVSAQFEACDDISVTMPIVTCL